MKIPKLPLKPPDSGGGFSRVFNFSRRGLILIITSVAVVLVAAIIITAAVSAGKVKTDLPSETVMTVPADRPFLSDFIIADDGLEESFTGIIYSREPSERWTDEQIAEYWVDPREIAAEQLEAESDKVMMDIFADVP